MRRYINDPLDVEWTDEQLRLMKWSDPMSDMSYDELKREGDGDFSLGWKRVQARFLGLPEPYAIDDGVEDLAGDVKFHKRLLLKFIAEGDTGFRVYEGDSLMLTALRFSQLHRDEWRQYVRRWNLDGKKLRRVYGVE